MRNYKLPSNYTITRFKNKKKTEIEIHKAVQGDGELSISIVVHSRMMPHCRFISSESMPITQYCLLCSWTDYYTIVNEVLRRDKVARRWFRRTIRGLVIDQSGTKMGDFLLPGDVLEVDKVREYSENYKLGLIK